MVNFLVTLMLVVLLQPAFAQEQPHFQVHDKEVGKLEVHATKLSAKVTAVADSVQMVLEPGTEELSTGKSSKRTLIHTGALMNTNTNKFKKKAMKKSLIKTNSINTDKKFKIKSRKGHNFKGLKATDHSLKVHDVTGDKKTLNDKEMRVHGRSGALHVHTDHNYTAVNSESGKLEIYIKNPDHYIDPKEVAEHSPDKMSVSIKTEAYKKDTSSKPHGRVHMIEDVTGLKKSYVNNERDRGGGVKKLRN